jgi:hypothetical protein
LFEELNKTLFKLKNESASLKTVNNNELQIDKRVEEDLEIKEYIIK